MRRGDLQSRYSTTKNTAHSLRAKPDATVHSQKQFGDPAEILMPAKPSVSLHSSSLTLLDFIFSYTTGAAGTMVPADVSDYPAASFTEIVRGLDMMSSEVAHPRLRFGLRIVIFGPCATNRYRVGMIFRY